MPHKCMKCGREFRDGSVEILRGCPSCGGKKFVYVSDSDKNDDVLQEKSIETIAKETNKEILEVQQQEDVRPTDILERVESVRIIGKGKYELNLERMADTQDIIIGMGTDGKYMLDLASMSKRRKSSPISKKSSK